LNQNKKEGGGASGKWEKCHQRDGLQMKYKVEGRVFRTGKKRGRNEAIKNCKGSTGKDADKVQLARVNLEKGGGKDE